MWPISAIGDLDGIGLGQVRHPKLVEASLYLVSQHHRITLHHLVVRQSQEGAYSLDVGGTFDIEIDEQKFKGPFRIQCKLSFSGIVVIPENLLPKPSNAQEVAAVVAPFISLVGFDEPRFEHFRYVLCPKG